MDATNFALFCCAVGAVLCVALAVLYSVAVAAEQGIHIIVRCFKLTKIAVDATKLEDDA